ncbi:MAG TPA: hypothetical protein VF530_12025 [Planctomycetota bacterium]
MGVSGGIQSTGRQGPARPRHYLVVLFAAGTLHGLGIAHGVRLVPWADALWVTFPPSFLSLFLVPSAWIAGWVLRGRIAASRGPSFVLAWLAMSLGAFVFGLAFTLMAVLGGLASGEWASALVMALLLPFAAAIWAALGFFYTIPVALPLTWIAVLVLRQAAGGVAEHAPRRCWLRARLAS